jgi:hypothetical protein
MNIEVLIEKEEEKKREGIFNQNDSHLVVTTTGFIVALDVFSRSKVSTHFCTLFPCKTKH